MNKRDISSSIVLILFATFVLVSSLGLGIGELRNPQPGLIPFAASFLLIIFGAILLAVNCRKNNPEINLVDLWRKLNWHKNIIVISVLIIYTIVLPIIGYILATFALMSVLFGLGRMKTWVVIISSVLSVLLSYGLFHYILKTPLPRAIWSF